MLHIGMKGKCQIYSKSVLLLVTLTSLVILTEVLPIFSIMIANMTIKGQCQISVWLRMPAPFTFLTDDIHI